MFGVVIGKSGRTRKSAGINAARDLFRAVGKPSIIEGFGSAEGLLVALGSAPAPNPVVLHIDEMSLLASKTDINGSAGLTALHKLFDGHACDHRLAKSSYEVRNAYLSLIAASTLEDFTKAWSGKHEDTGFFGRLLLVAGDAEKRIPRPIDPDSDKFQALVSEVKELISSVAEHPLVVTVEHDADELWAKFYDSFGDGPEWNRIDAYGFRLMAVQAVLRGEKTVNKKNIQQVIDFLQYEVAVREAVAPVIAENAVARMEELIRRALPLGQTRTKRQLDRKTNSHRYGIDSFNRALENLQKNGEILPTRKDGTSILYTRAEVDEQEESVFASVIETHDDEGEMPNPSNGAAFAHASGNSLHAVMRAPCADEQVVI